jgi:hypothetical protein
MLQEGVDLDRREVNQGEMGYRPVVALRYKPEEQTPCVTVGSNSMHGGIPLLDHPLIEEGMQ